MPAWKLLLPKLIGLELRVAGGAGAGLRPRFFELISMAGQL